MKIRFVLLLAICLVLQCGLALRAMEATDLLRVIRDDNAKAIQSYQGDVDQLIPSENELCTPLAVAILERKQAVLDALLAKKANPNKTINSFQKTGPNGSIQPYELTPLHIAAKTGNFPALISLLEADADPRANDSLGIPPVWYAAEGGFTACACALMLHHADPSEQHYGKSSYEIAPAKTAELMHMVGKGNVNSLLIYISELFGTPLSQPLMDFKNSPHYPLFSRPLPRR